MTENLKKRIYTSISLLILLFLMSINNYIFGYFLIIAGLLSVLEFFKMSLIIFRNNKFKRFFYDSIFLTYIFSVCSVLFIFSSFLHLKILIFIIIIICITSDIGGFIFGKIFKGPKLTKISPGKTVSGAIGSLILSIVLATLLFFFITNNFDFKTIIIGFLISVSCQIGDLFFSYLKRKSSLKDSGSLLPGHGGILDRIDGLLFGIPIGFLTLLIIY
jgi:phosphatidate cytidylyltransferase